VLPLSVICSWFCALPLLTRLALPATLSKAMSVRSKVSPETKPETVLLGIVEPAIRNWTAAAERDRAADHAPQQAEHRAGAIDHRVAGNAAGIDVLHPAAVDRRAAGNAAGGNGLIVAAEDDEARDRSALIDVERDLRATLNGHIIDDTRAARRPLAIGTCQRQLHKAAVADHRATGDAT
jgi:hypothetical protein